MGFEETTSGPGLVSASACRHTNQAPWTDGWFWSRGTENPRRTRSVLQRQEARVGQKTGGSVTQGHES